MEVKPGVTTSEFWLSASSFVLGLILALIGLWRHDQDLVDKGFYLAVGANLGYALSRGLAKIGGGPLSVLKALGGNALGNLDKIPFDKLIGLLQGQFPAPTPAGSGEEKPAEPPAPAPAKSDVEAAKSLVGP